jgi:hypothetical protein
MADAKSQSFFQDAIDWFKSVFEWIPQHMGDPGLSASLRSDLGLNPNSDANVVTLPHTKELDPDKESFNETIAEVTKLVTAATAWGDTVKNGGDGWDAFFLVAQVASASSVHANLPALYALGKLGSVISSDPEDVETVAITPIKQLLSGKGFDANTGDAVVRMLIESSFMLVPALDWLLHDNKAPVSIQCFYGWDPFPGSATPVADDASSGVTTILLTHNGGVVGEKVGLTLAPMPAAFQGPALMLGLSGGLKLNLDEHGRKWAFEVDASSGRTLFVPLRGGEPKFKLVKGDPKFSLSIAISHEAAADEPPAFRLGGATGTRFEARSLQFGLRADGAGVGLTFRLVDAALIINLGEDAFLGQVAPAELKIDIDVGFALSTDGGFRLDGGSQLHVSLPINKSIAGVFTIFSLELELGPGEGGHDIGLLAAGGFSFKLGPFAATVDRIGMRTDLSFRKGNLGPIDMALAFKPPSGIGLTIDAGVVKGGGYLFAEPNLGRYAGALELKIGPVGVKALGVISTKWPDGTSGWSFLLLIYFDFPPIQLSFGFVLSGAGGMIGLQHGMSLDAIRSGLKTGALNDVLFPRDPVADAPRLINTLLTIFPPTRYAFTIGPMFELGWGTPLIVAMRLGLLVELDNALGGDRPVSLSKIVLLGVLSADLPFRNDMGLAILHLEVDFLGYLDFGNKQLGFEAVLRNSRVLGTLELFGGLSLFMQFGEHPDFIFSAGGVFPGYTQFPTGFHPPDRLGLQMSMPPARLRLEIYFAISPATIQAGAKLEVWYGVSGVGEVHGFISFDALCERHPFHFKVLLNALLEAKVFDHKLSGIAVKAELSGPGLWVLDGDATVSILLWHVSLPVHTSFGEADAAPTATTNVQSALLLAAKDNGNWGAQPALGADTMVTLAPAEPGGRLLAHPLAALTFTQKVAPFGLTLEKVGTNTIEGPNRFDVTGVTINDVLLPTPPTSLPELFARSQYVELPAERRMAEPEFEPMAAGIRIGSDAFALPPPADATAADIVFETLDYDDVVRSSRQTLLGADLIVHAQIGAVARGAGRVHDALRTEPARAMKTALSVNPPRYAVVDAVTLAAVGGVALTDSTRASFSMAQQALRGAGVARQVIQSFEIALAG